MAHAMPRHWKIANPLAGGGEDADARPSVSANENGKKPDLSDMQQFVPTAPMDSMPEHLKDMVALHQAEFKKAHARG